MMTYRELYDSLIEKYADEKGIIRGKPCALLYRVSRAGEAAGFDNTISQTWEDGLLIEVALND